MNEAVGEARNQKSAQVSAVPRSGATVDIFGHALADVILMSKNGWLEPIDYGAYRKEDIAGIAQEDRVEHGMGFIYWSEVMAYRTDVFPTCKHPRDRAEFWDTKRFPGPRSFGDPGYTYSIEFAALADGVPRSLSKHGKVRGYCAYLIGAH
jgi:putative spermidine/putrescine transport system substrate-binding protein